MEPLFTSVTKEKFGAFLATYPEDRIYEKPTPDQREIHEMGHGGKFHRSMIAYEEKGQFFILNELGHRTLGEPLPLLGDE